MREEKKPVMKVIQFWIFIFWNEPTFVTFLFFHIFERGMSSRIRSLKSYFCVISSLNKTCVFPMPLWKMSIHNQSDLVCHIIMLGLEVISNNLGFSSDKLYLAAFEDATVEDQVNQVWHYFLFVLSAHQLIFLMLKHDSFQLVIYLWVDTVKCFTEPKEALFLQRVASSAKVMPLLRCRPWRRRLLPTAADHLVVLKSWRPQVLKTSTTTCHQSRVHRVWHDSDPFATSATTTSMWETKSSAACWMEKRGCGSALVIASLSPLSVALDK